MEKSGLPIAARRKEMKSKMAEYIERDTALDKQKEGTDEKG